MKIGRTSVLSVGVFGLATLVALADVRTNIYESIFRRNPFGLKDPPPPPDPTAQQPVTPPAPLPVVKLTGITTILSAKPKVLLEVTEPGGKGQPKPTPPLFEGERYESVEIVSVNVASSLVKIKIGDFETNLTFPKVEAAKSGPAAPAAGAPVMPTFRPPGMPGAPGATPMAPGASAAFGGAGSGSGGVMVFGASGSGTVPGAGGARSAVTTFGASTPTTPAGGSIPTVPSTALGGFTPAASAAYSGTDASTIRSIPTRTIRTDQATPATPAANTGVRPRSKEEADLLIEMIREKNRGKFVPPLPPTSLSHMIDHPDSKYFPTPQQPPIPAPTQ